MSDPKAADLLLAVARNDLKALEGMAKDRDVREDQGVRERVSRGMSLLGSQ